MCVAGSGLSDGHRCHSVTKSMNGLCQVSCPVYTCVCAGVDAPSGTRACGRLVSATGGVPLCQFCSPVSLCVRRPRARRHSVSVTVWALQRALWPQYELLCAGRMPRGSTVRVQVLVSPRHVLCPPVSRRRCCRALSLFTLSLCVRRSQCPSGNQWSVAVRSLRWAQCQPCHSLASVRCVCAGLVPAALTVCGGSESTPDGHCVAVSLSR